MPSNKIIGGTPITDSDPLQVQVTGGAVPASLGQKTMAASSPVVIASDQSAVPVVGGLAPVSITFTRPADTTAYAANDVVSNSTSATTMQAVAVARATDKSGYIVGIRVATNKKSITPRLRVHLYRDNGATVSADNAAMKSVYADDGKRIGSYDLAALATPADTTNSDQSAQTEMTMRIPFVPKSGSQNVYVVLETLDAFTPDSGQSFTVTLWADQN